MAKTNQTRFEFIGDGAVRTFAVPFSFLKEEDVEVYVDDVLMESTIGSGFVTLATAPEVGAKILVLRSTEARIPLHSFQHGSPLLPKLMDDNFRQTLYVVEESINMSEAALIKSEEALDKADEALDKSNEALDKSNEALGKADEALGSIDDLNTRIDGFEDLVDNKLDGFEDSLDGVIADKLGNQIVTSFNGRTGDVTPMDGDYSYNQLRDKPEIMSAPELTFEQVSNLHNSTFGLVSGVRLYEAINAHVPELKVSDDDYTYGRANIDLIKRVIDTQLNLKVPKLGAGDLADSSSSKYGVISGSVLNEYIADVIDNSTGGGGTGGGGGNGGSQGSTEISPDSFDDVVSDGVYHGDTYFDIASASLPADHNTQSSWVLVVNTGYNGLVIQTLYQTREASILGMHTDIFYRTKFNDVWSQWVFVSNRSRLEVQNSPLDLGSPTGSVAFQGSYIYSKIMNTELLGGRVLKELPIGFNEDCVVEFDVRNESLDNERITRVQTLKVLKDVPNGPYAGLTLRNYSVGPWGDLNLSKWRLVEGRVPQHMEGIKNLGAVNGRSKIIENDSVFKMQIIINIYNGYCELTLNNDPLSSISIDTSGDRSSVNTFILNPYETLEIVEWSGHNINILAKYLE